MSYILGLDVGGSAIKYALMDKEANFIEKGTIPTPLDTKEHFIEAIVSIYNKFEDKVEGLALSMPGNIDSDTGHIDTPGALEFNYNTNIFDSLHEKIPNIKKEETISFNMDKLKKGETYVGKPVYEKDPITENLNSYVEIDITRQMFFMYLNGECILETPTVTGNIGAGYYTPTGVFYLNNKVRDTVLRGSNRDGSKYASPVLYWMPFYKGFGMHDANWRNKFGGEIYKNNGSHGCVNLPTNAAKTIYENITYDMPIFIYKS